MTVEVSSHQRLGTQPSAPTDDQAPGDAAPPPCPYEPRRWRHHPHGGRRIGKLLARVLTIAVLILAPVAAGITAVDLAPPAQVDDVGIDGLTASVDIQIGRNTEDIDLALIGLRRESPTILGKHVAIVVRPDATNLNLFDANGSLNSDQLSLAGHLFADRDAEVNRLVGEVLRYYETMFFGAAYLVAMGEVLAYIYRKHRRRVVADLSVAERITERHGHSIERRTGKTVAVVAVVALLASAGYIVSPLSDQTVPVTPEAQLNGTFLSGWQITGPLKTPILAAIGSVDSLSKQEQSFYDLVSANMAEAYTAYYGVPNPDRGNEELRYVVLDDLQGTSGMAKVAGQAAANYHANAILYLGDLTATGTKEESYASYLKSYTVDVLAQSAGKTPVYASLGRHDTPTVRQYATKAHIRVADNAPMNVGGVSMIGENSAWIVNFGEAARLIDPKITDETLDTRLSATACSSAPAVVFTHDKELLDQVQASGCSPIVIGGHSYTGEPASNVTADNGTTVRRIILGSTGGHGAGDGIGGLSTPRNPAPFVMLSIDKQTGEVHVDTTTVHPDASVTVTRTDLAPLTSDQLARFGH